MTLPDPPGTRPAGGRDDLVFSAEAPPAAEAPPWKILIADDEEEVHSVTRLALAQLTFDGRPLEFLDAYSGREAVEIMAANPDVAIALVDVVMETESAGLDAINAIRSQLDNQMVRLVLRTGQPGQAPEREVVEKYDINDYKEKTELTATKLFTLIYTGLSQYRDMHQMGLQRAGLQRVLGASSRLFERRTPDQIATVALQELAALLDLDITPHHKTDGGLAVEDAGSDNARILAGVGRYSGYGGQVLREAVGPDTRARLEAPIDFGLWRLDEQFFCARVPGRRGGSVTLYLVGAPPVRRPSREVVDLFCSNLAVGFDNARLNAQVEQTQSEIVYMLSEAIEKRSNETGFHVRRVGEYSALLARLAGLPEAECETLRLASPLHDAGKIAIPDAILNKPGRHTEAEKKVMDSHARLGSEIFRNQTLPVLQAAAIVAAQHHERWDGRGYPARLRGEDIHIYGRVTALADVFDALGSQRCYKDPWPLEEILELIRNEKGRHFDPELVELFFAHLDQFLDIRLRFPDPTD